MPLYQKSLYTLHVLVDGLLLGSKAASISEGVLLAFPNLRVILLMLACEDKDWWTGSNVITSLPMDSP